MDRPTAHSYVHSGAKSLVDCWNENLLSLIMIHDQQSCNSLETERSDISDFAYLGIISGLKLNSFHL